MKNGCIIYIPIVAGIINSINFLFLGFNTEKIINKKQTKKIINIKQRDQQRKRQLHKRGQTKDKRRQIKRQKETEEGQKETEERQEETYIRRTDKR